LIHAQRAQSGPGQRCGKRGSSFITSMRVGYDDGADTTVERDV